MNREKYLLLKKIMETVSDNRIRELNRKYSTENQKYKYGDILKDYHIIIMVQSVIHGVMAHGGEVPTCIYKGVKLTTSLKPDRQQDETFMYEYSVQEKLN
jgi:hypothetical protein